MRVIRTIASSLPLMALGLASGACGNDHAAGPRGSITSQEAPAVVAAQLGAINIQMANLGAQLDAVLQPPGPPGEPPGPPVNRALLAHLDAIGTRLGQVETHFMAIETPPGPPNLPVQRELLGILGSATKIGTTAAQQPLRSRRSSPSRPRSGRSRRPSSISSDRVSQVS